MDYGAAFAQAWVIAFAITAAGLLSSIPLYMVFRWWSEGQVNGGEALGLVGMFLLLFVSLMGPTPAPLKLIIAVLMIGAALGMALLPVLTDKKSLKSFEQERETLYRTAVESNPQNIAARIELARNLYTQKRISEAIETLEMAIQLSPTTTKNEQTMLKSWLREKDDAGSSIMICRWCRQDTPADRPECVHCGRPLSLLREATDAVTSDPAGIVKSFLILMPVLLVIGLFFSLLGNTLFGMLLMAVLVVAGMWWIRYRVGSG